MLRNHDCRDTDRTKVDGGGPTRSPVDFDTEIYLDENRNGSPGNASAWSTLAA